VKVEKSWKSIMSVFFAYLFLMGIPAQADETTSQKMQWMDGKDFVVGEVQNLHKNILKELQENKKSREKIERLLSIMGFEEKAANDFIGKSGLLPQNIELFGPWPLFYILTNQLIDYVNNAEKDPWKLIIPTGAAFAVAIDGQVQISVTLINKEPQSAIPRWGIAAWSPPSETEFLRDPNVGINEEKCKPLQVEVPTLYARLQGCEDPNNHENVRFKLIKFGPNKKSKPSDFRPAAQVFKELAEEAKNPNYNFPRR
jgi:hypothetical protein